jgi:hypothetical protein
MMNSNDLLARLLANENLNVIRANVSTASFEGLSRTLTLPMWKDMSPAVEEMLIGHEVGHARYTTNDCLDFPRYRKIHGYANIIEDVRIEKKIKIKYPGLRKAFIAGYKELVDRDFFEIKDKDLSKLLLIDRINLYYKVGFNCGVKFTPEEMEYVRAVDKCDTMKDVCELASTLYDLGKAERDAMKEDIRLNFPLESPEDSFMDDEEDFDTYAPDEDGDESHSETEIPNELSEEEEEAQEEEDLAPKTQQALDSRLQGMADTKTIVYSFVPEFWSERDPIVSFKKIIGELTFDFAAKVVKQKEYYGERVSINFEKNAKSSAALFKTNSMRTVNYLVKEFEMRKSASEYRRSSSATSGDLDTRKLYAYTLTNDIFKKLEIIPEDKNHGMIFLLDWSGSMSNVMEDTVKQVINLAMFCQRIQIPYQVFAFSSGYESVNAKISRDEQNPNNMKFADSSFHMLELFSNKMTNTEFNKMIELLLANPWSYAVKYNIHGTPLNESMLFLTKYIGKFIKNNNVEKMSLITLTDGEGHSLSSQSGSSIRDYEYNSMTGRSSQVKNYMRDPITKKEYSLTSEGPQQTRVFLNIIKDRYNIKTVGFHILANSRRDVGSFIRANMPQLPITVEYNMVEQLRKDIRQNDFALITNAGRDEMYLLPASKQRIEEGELEVSTAMNSKQIAREFGKYLNVKKSSRVVLSRFVTLIA